MRSLGVALLGFLAAIAFAVPAAAQDAPRPKAKVVPAKKAAAAKPKKGAAVAPKKTRKPGEERHPDEALRRVISGTGAQGAKTTRESAELRAMRELDLQLFPSQLPSASAPWIAEGSPLEGHTPHVSSSGLPADTALETLPRPEGPQDLTWLKRLDMPDIPVRWDARVVRYLEYYKNTSRGRAMVREFVKKSGRYGAQVRKTLREQGLPEDILWLALVESGFDATIHSPVGAAGLWQFMPDGAKVYGLSVDRWIDERLDPERETVAAARYLHDLHTRFGNWELAFAAYNMGYGGLLASIRKYNSNDFWELSRLESGMPLETALYVPKIVAMAIVAKNRAVFGCGDVELEPSIPYDKIAIGPGVSLKTVALAAEVALERIEELNPQVVAGRTPPDQPNAKLGATWTVRVPAGRGAKAANDLVKWTSAESLLARYRVRWGETVDDIATSRHVSKGSLLALNGIRRDEVVRPGTLLFVPAATGEGVAAASANVIESSNERPVVVVPAQPFAYPDRKRAFYRVVSGDTLHDVSGAIGVTMDELCRWNALDPGAQLHDGMTLQVFVAQSRSLEAVALLPERSARVLAVGTPEFFSYFEAQRGRKRVELVAKDGDTWRAVAKRYGVSLGQLERINQRARTSPLASGDKLVVYVPLDKSMPAAAQPARDDGFDVTKTVDAERDHKAHDVEAATIPATTTRPADGIISGELRPDSP